MPCRAHAVPLPCRVALIHTCHAAPLPFSDSAVSFVKVHVLAGNIRAASPTYYVDQQYALICTTPLFYILAPTCFGSSLPSSGSLLDPPELLEIQIEWVVYHIMCGYVTCVLDCRGSVCFVSQLSAYCWSFLIRMTMHGMNIKLLVLQFN
jgi:hypothetical protein